MTMVANFKYKYKYEHKYKKMCFSPVNDHGGKLLIQKQIQNTNTITNTNTNTKKSVSPVNDHGGKLPIRDDLILLVLHLQPVCHELHLPDEEKNVCLIGKLLAMLIR